MEVCILLQNFLSRKKLRVTYANTLKDAISKFEGFQPDLLILDHNMPDGYGIQHIQHFRQMKSPLKIVIISAMSNLKDEALVNGADHFLEKPISFGTLNNIIQAS
jgi:DNA-binding response OmpR family regulator